jgi:hypothetical protein
MKMLKAHFDGSVFVPDEPVDLPVDRPLNLSVAVVGESPEEAADLRKLAALAQTVAGGNSDRRDPAAQHDHYLYGTPKRA